MARDKGARGERELAKILNENGIAAHRGYVQFKQSDLVGIPGIHPEVKRVEKLNIHEAMRQAIEEAEKRQDGAPTVFHRKNGGKWLVTMLLEDWMKIYKEGNANG
jgi:Holliday junction resolvase